MAKIVVALGGNALGSSLEEQKELVKHTAVSIVDLVIGGNQVIVTHGNGPQVGMIQLGFEVAAAYSERVFPMPLKECCAMSQGYIGHHLHNALLGELQSRALAKPVVSLITHTVVSAQDDAFSHPSKPIGSFYSKEQAAKLVEQGIQVKEEAHKGFRRVVASPLPLAIVETPVIEALIEKDVLVVCCGGGGVPVVADDQGYRAVDAIVDKDYASACLARLIQADKLLILTAVEQVALHFNTPQQVLLKELSSEQAKSYIKEGHFAAGSMLPKVRAALSFVENSPSSREAIITSLIEAPLALKGEKGTRITA